MADVGGDERMPFSEIAKAGAPRFCECGAGGMHGAAGLPDRPEALRAALLLLSSRLSRSAPELHRVCPGSHVRPEARGLYRRWGLCTPPRRKKRREVYDGGERIVKNRRFSCRPSSQP